MRILRSLASHLLVLLTLGPRGLQSSYPAGRRSEIQVMFSSAFHHVSRRRLLVLALGVLMALITQLPAAAVPLTHAGAPVASSAAANAQLFLPVIAKAPSKDWPMLAANPRRTSWTPEEVRAI